MTRRSGPSKEVERILEKLKPRLPKIPSRTRLFRSIREWKGERLILKLTLFRFIYEEAVPGDPSKCAWALTLWSQIPKVVLGSRVSGVRYKNGLLIINWDGYALTFEAGGRPLRFAAALDEKRPWPFPEGNELPGYFKFMGKTKIETLPRGRKKRRDAGKKREKVSPRLHAKNPRRYRGLTQPDWQLLEKYYQQNASK